MPAGEVGKDLVLVASLGAGNTGLATVGYTLKNADGTTKQVRTTAGVTEIGGGWYRVRALAALWTAAGGFQVDWDIATVFKASEDISIVDAPSGGGGGDPWATDIASGYTGTEAGAILNAVKAKTDLLSGATSITLIAPVLSSGKVVVIQGDDYKNVDGRALQWSSTSWPVLTSGTVTLYLEKKSDGVTFSKAGTVVSASSVRVDLTAAETTAREVGAYRYALKATLSDGDKVTLATGDLVVEEKP